MHTNPRIYDNQASGVYDAGAVWEHWFYFLIARNLTELLGCDQLFTTRISKPIKYGINANEKHVCEFHNLADQLFFRETAF